MERLKPSGKSARMVAVGAFSAALAVQVALLILVRGHGADWFAGGNSPAQAVAGASSVVIAVMLAVQIALCLVALRLMRYGTAWALLPAPVITWMVFMLALAAAGPTPAA